jgi:dihydroorotate dehydrogenase (fumarate)
MRAPPPSAIVLYSLFEEQLRQENVELDHHLSEGMDSFAEASSFFPQPSEFHLGPEGYLDHIRVSVTSAKEF